MRERLPQFARDRLDPQQRYGLRVTLLAIAVVLVAVPFSTLLFQVLAKGPLTRADGAVANWMNDAVRSSPFAVEVLQAVSLLGRPVWLAAIVALAVLFVWRRGRGRLAVFLIVTSLGGGLVDSAVKIAVDRPRPVVDHPVATAFGKSFPSGHAMSSVVVYGALLLVFLPVLPRRWRPVAAGATAGLALAIGCSRLLLGVHFVSDVIGGYVLGLAWLAGATAAFEIWRVERGQRRTEPLAEGVEPEAAAALGGDDNRA